LDAPDNLLQALDVWPSIVEVIGKRRPLIVSLIERATPIRCEDASLTLGFPRPFNHHQIEQVLASTFGGTWKVDFELRDDLPNPDPVLAEGSHERQSTEQQRQSLPEYRASRRSGAKPKS
jgi:hypothetical protein